MIKLELFLDVPWGNATPEVAANTVLNAAFGSGNQCIYNEHGGETAEIRLEGYTVEVLKEFNGEGT